MTLTLSIGCGPPQPFRLMEFRLATIAVTPYMAKQLSFLMTA